LEFLEESTQIKHTGLRTIFDTGANKELKRPAEAEIHIYDEQYETGPFIECTQVRSFYDK
jgi:hypothetical protein